jgi:hypothetical protein
LPEVRNVIFCGKAKDAFDDGDSGGFWRRFEESFYVVRI